jgi:ABC-type phosphate transport system ATPase subunit
MVFPAGSNSGWHRPGAGSESGVLLLDEAKLLGSDPIATAKIEDLIFQLKGNCTIVIVTYNMRQPASPTIRDSS